MPEHTIPRAAVLRYIDEVTERQCGKGSALLGPIKQVLRDTLTWLRQHVEQAGVVPCERTVSFTAGAGQTIVGCTRLEGHEGACSAEPDATDLGTVAIALGLDASATVADCVARARKLDADRTLWRRKFNAAAALGRDVRQRWEERADGPLMVDDEPAPLLALLDALEAES